MTKEKFAEWMKKNVDPHPLNPYTEWISRRAYDILREEPFNEEKADAFEKMVRFDFSRSLYFFVI